MGNVLDTEKQQQSLALGRLGWTLSRIADKTGVHRVTAGGYLRAAGLPVRGRGRSGDGPPQPTITPAVSTDSPVPTPTRAPSASACEAYREVIAEAVGRGRNAMATWQDPVDDHGFPARYASVRRFVVHLHGRTPVEARVMITTAPGEEGQVSVHPKWSVRTR